MLKETLIGKLYLEIQKCEDSQARFRQQHGVSIEHHNASFAAFRWAYIQIMREFFVVVTESRGESLNGKVPSFEKMKDKAVAAGQEASGIMLDISERARIVFAIEKMCNNLIESDNSEGIKQLENLRFTFAKRFNDILRLWKFRQTRWADGKVTKTIPEFIHTFHQQGGEVEKIDETNSYGAVFELYCGDAPFTVASLLTALKKQFGFPLETDSPNFEERQQLKAPDREFYLTLGKDKKGKKDRISIVIGTSLLEELLKEVDLEEPWDKPHYNNGSAKDPIPVKTLGNLIEYASK